MSHVRTLARESASRRNVFKVPQNQKWRETRAEIARAETLLEYRSAGGDQPKWCALFYGGEFRAG